MNKRRNLKKMLVSMAGALCAVVLGLSAGTLTAEAATQLAAPTNLYWDDNYVGHFTKTDSADYNVIVALYNEDDEWFATWTLGGGTGEVSVSLKKNIYESGSYYFVVTAKPKDTDTEHTSSESVKSELKTYVKPSSQVGSATAKWDSSKPGTISWDAVDGAEAYDVMLYQKEAFGWNGRGAIVTGGTTADFSHSISENGAGQYCVKIRVLSADITKLANRDYGDCDFSEIYNATDSIIENINDTTTDTTTADNSANASAVDTPGAFSAYLGGLVSQIENAADGETIIITKDSGMDALPNSIMQALYQKKTVSLKMEYTYNEEDYTLSLEVCSVSVSFGLAVTTK